MPAPPRPAGPGGRTPALGVPLLTLERFEQAMQVAKLAADQGLFDLSARAVRESLKGGPPAVVEAPAGTRSRVVVRNGTAVEPQDPVPGRVVARFLELDPVWKRRKAPADLVYKALLAAVAPEARPGDLFLYAQPLGAGGTLRARSVGAMLADWAVRAGETDALLGVAETRGRQPLAAAPALVLKAQVALAAGRDADLSAALAAILDRVKKDSLRNTAEQAVIAALPALDRPAALEPALQVLEAGLKAYETGGEEGPAAPLMLAIARRRFAAGDLEGARKRLDGYIEIVERTGNVSYGGDYLLYRRKLNLRTVAGEFARAGDWAGALEQLGRMLDAPSYSGGDPDAGDALRRTLRAMDALPAADRYAALKAWTLPTESRRLIRALTTAGTADAPPDLFLGKPSGPSGGESTATVCSTTSALVRAAVDAGKLDELAKEARAAVEQKIENAEVLDRLVSLAAGRADEVAGPIRSRIDDLARENASPPETPAPRAPRQKPKTFPWDDYLTMRAARSSDKPKLRALGLELLKTLDGQARRHSNPLAVSQVRRELSEVRADEAGASKLASSTAVDLPGWSSFGTANVPSPALWIRHQGLTALVTGAGRDRLAFDYPLSGDFELSLDVFRGAWADGGVLYGGLSADPNASPESPGAYDPEAVRRPWKYGLAENFNRIKLRVSPESVRMYMNGHLMHEEKDPSPTSPWLMLGAGSGQLTAWRNVEIKGNPAIPREVKLSHQDRLEGWSTLFYNETRLPRRTPKPTSVGDSSGAISMRKTRASTNPDDYDWSAEGGVIRGRKLPPSGLARSGEYYEESSRGAVLPQDAAQSLLAYERPLRDGDVLTYSFFCDPGEVMVHPALGRIAFLLEPGGVRLHWLTGGANDLSGLSAANAVDVPAHRKGDGDLPLKPNDWNTLTLAVSASSAALELNGRAIYEHLLTPADDRRFGLYHDKDRTAVQVRDVVLKGRWPASLPDADREALALRAPAGTATEADRRARHAVIGERLFSLGAEHVLASAPADADARYRALSEWVLPSSDHPAFRLQGDSSPAGPPPPSEAGGRLRAPAIAMVEAAAATGKLAELSGRVDAAPAADDAARRGKLALQALIALARGEDAEAPLAALKPLLEASSPEQEEWARWPELVAASAAVERGKSIPAAQALLEILAVRSQKQPIDRRWERRVKGARSLALLASQYAGAPAAGADGSPWVAVSHATAETRGGGSPAAHWLRKGDEVVHLPGHANDYLYLTTPLRGDFQIDCELTSFNYREARISYGGLAIAPNYDLKRVDRFRLGRPIETIEINPPLDKIGDRYAYRLVVKGDRMTCFVSGRQVDEVTLPAERDPWLAFFSHPGLTAGVKDFRISGEPTIPERLNLSILPDLTGWRADYYGDTLVGAPADWEKRGDEIYGRLRTEYPGAKQESVLNYHRPIVEDGELTYEFFYEPGRSATHPALDRLTLLLEPEGVKVHWLTDAADERNGLDAGNATVEPENRRGPASLPLKEKDWNRVALEIAGDRATLRLNGAEVYARAIEPTNRRTFGLFHFADESEVRVRNVSYAGRWPRKVPDSPRPAPAGRP